MEDQGPIAQYGTSLIADCMERFGAMDGGIRRLSGDRLVGSAYPVEVVAGENRTLHLAIESAPPGSVLVVDAQAHAGRAVWGDVLTVAAMSQGIRGIVVDGVVRDVDDMRQRGYPVFARGCCPAGPHKGWPGRIGAPIACGGVVVAQGDIIVGDGDGVVVIPQDRIDAVAAASKERQELEDTWIDRISAGEPGPDVLGLR